jgi:hypothetical protein
MKKTLILLFVILVFQFSMAQPASETWSFEKAKGYYLAQKDPAKWDTALLEMDGAMTRNNRLPIQSGSFPVAKYNTLGNGNMPLDFKIGSNILSGQSVFVATKVDKTTTPVQVSVDVSFIILVLSDSVNNGTSFVSSRNHPNYLSEGKISMADYDIDWVAMQIADGNAYAIVNMKLFDLRFGRLIIVAPQKDDTLRFLQVETNDVKVDGDAQSYLNSIRKRLNTFIGSNKVSSFIAAWK